MDCIKMCKIPYSRKMDCIKMCKIPYSKKNGLYQNV